VKHDANEASGGKSEDVTLKGQSHQILVFILGSRKLN
jgi:hypothetical protein